MTKLFPILLITLQFSASLVYLSKKDYRQGIYWLAATVLTIAVTV